MPEQGFLASLFDVSFKSLITTRVIKVIYVLSMILIGLGALVFVAAAFANSVGAGLFTLIVIAPLVSLLYLIYLRVVLEIVIAIFRIMETNVELVALQRGGAAPASTPPAYTPPASTTPPPSSPPQPPQPPPTTPPPTA
jgi:hypothetical protein